MKLKIRSHIPRLCRVLHIDQKEFVRRCIVDSVCGVDAAKRIYRGDTSIRLVTAAGVAKILNLNFADLFEVRY